MSVSSRLPPEPTLDDVLAARRTLRPFLAPTPLYRHPGLSRLLDADVLVKHENHLPTGAFKVRGGVNLMANLSADERRRGVVTASTGNHGQSIAWAGSRVGVRTVIFAPTNATAVKVDAMRGFGAELVLEGIDFEGAKRAAARLAEAEGMRFISSGDEPYLIAGVAKTLSPRTRVVAVQARGAPAAYETWKTGVPTVRPIETAAAGLATGETFALPQQMLRRLLDDCLLVDDDDMFKAVRLLLELAKTTAEPAAAASLAAALQMRDQLKGRRVALIVSGGNISPDELRRALDS